MYQGINRDNLIKDITKLEYQNGEIKNLFMKGDCYENKRTGNQAVNGNP